MTEKLLITYKDKTLNALQKCELECLKEFDRICRKYGIEYSLGGGTCLGQVRHGGFIPWDDDIDVDMTLENYDKFMSVASNEIDSDRFFLRSRVTDKKYLRSCSRFEMLNTEIGLKQWDKNRLNVGIFVDIFCWSYLPNNKILRRIVSSSLFYIRCIENYKMYHQVAKKTNILEKIFVGIFANVLPYRLVLYIDNKLLHCCGDKKTNWIIDDAIINGNHGGYPSSGIDEYQDVKFENLIVRNKLNSDNFLRTIYGDNYNKWLKPQDRISHHKWTKLKIEDSYIKDLPTNYSDYLTIKYNLEKLEQMEKTSLSMAKIIDEICFEHSLKYIVWSAESFYKSKNIDKLGYFFQEPLTIAMKRSDYNSFLTIIKDFKSNIYYFSNYNMDNNNCLFVKMYLKNTLLAYNKNYNGDSYNEFFIKIIPLDYLPNNQELAKKQLRKIKLIKRAYNNKVRNKNIKKFIKSKFLSKIKYILLMPFSLNSLSKLIEKEASKHSDNSNTLLIDFQSDYRQFMEISDLDFDYAEKKNFLGYDLYFADNFKALNKKVSKNSAFLLKHYIDAVEKEADNKEIQTIEKLYKESLIKKIKKRHGYCFLNYFDSSEYQLSILRYNEEENVIMSNVELFGEDLYKG